MDPINILHVINRYLLPIFSELLYPFNINLKINKIMEKSILPKLAFDTLKKAENCYNEEGSFPNEVLESMHSYFGEPLLQATELLEKCRIIRYSTPDSYRSIYKLCTSREQHTVFDNNINVCQCYFFKTKVLEARTSLTCKHVLAVALARIMGKFKEEIVSENVYEEFLNEQLNFCLDIDTQNINLN